MGCVNVGDGVVEPAEVLAHRGAGGIGVLALERCGHGAVIAPQGVGLVRPAKAEHAESVDLELGRLDGF